MLTADLTHYSLPIPPQVDQQNVGICSLKSRWHGHLQTTIDILQHAMYEVVTLYLLAEGRSLDDIAGKKDSFPGFQHRRIRKRVVLWTNKVAQMPHRYAPTLGNYFDNYNQ